MINAPDQIVYAFDTETTGTDVLRDRIVSATIAKLVGGEPAGERSWLIDPGVEIPAEATKVHGITTEHARATGVHPMEALQPIRDTLAAILCAGYPLAVMNAAYDLSILHAELARWAMPTLRDETDDGWTTLIDPLVIARGIDTERRDFQRGRKYRLPDLCKRYGINFAETHDATADAIGAGQLALAILDRSEDVIERNTTPGQLYMQQLTWRTADQLRFKKWVENNGKQEQYGDIDAGWPLHTELTKGNNNGKQ